MSEVFGVTGGGPDLLHPQSSPHHARIMTPTQVMQHRAEREREKERERARERERERERAREKERDQYDRERERQRLHDQTEKENARLQDESVGAAAPIDSFSASGPATGVARHHKHLSTADPAHKRTNSAADHHSHVPAHISQSSRPAQPLQYQSHSAGQPTIPASSQPSQKPHTRSQSYGDTTRTQSTHIRGASGKHAQQHRPSIPPTQQTQSSSSRPEPEILSNQPPSQAHVHPPSQPNSRFHSGSAPPPDNSAHSIRPSTSQQPAKFKVSSFPHAFERWENLSAHWEGLTSYWIRKLEMNATDVRNEPLLQQMSRQINDLTAAGANLFHAVVELQRLRASSERKFQRWFIDVRGEMERLEEVNGQTLSELEQERRARIKLQAEIDKLRRRAGETTEHATQTNNELRRALDVSKEEACRAWEELGRREQEERDRCADLREGRPINVCGVWIYPTTQVTRQMSVKRPEMETDPEPYQAEFVEANFVYGQAGQSQAQSPPVHAQGPVPEHRRPHQPSSYQHSHQQRPNPHHQHHYQPQFQQGGISGIAPPQQQQYGSSDPFMEAVERPGVSAPRHGAVNVGRPTIQTEQDVMMSSQPVYYSYEKSPSQTSTRMEFSPVKGISPGAGGGDGISSDGPNSAALMHPSMRVPNVDYHRSQQQSQPQAQPGPSAQPQSSTKQPHAQMMAHPDPSPMPANRVDPGMRSGASGGAAAMAGSTTTHTSGANPDKVATEGIASQNLTATAIPSRQGPDYEGQGYALVEPEWPLQNPAAVTSSGVGIGMTASPVGRQQQQQPPQAQPQRQHLQQPQHHYASRLSDVLEEDESSNAHGSYVRS